MSNGAKRSGESRGGVANSGPQIVIEGIDTATGAEAVAPEARGRTQTPQTQYVPRPGAVEQALQREVENFLFVQAALLDAKDWSGWMECFTEDGIYWMPVESTQTSWRTEPSIFAEDRLMMEVRTGRLNHPNAWSQAPMWGTSHLVGNVVIESGDPAEVQVCSRFQMMELRRDDIRHFAGTYRHTLRRTGTGLRIALQRVDMMNGQATYDYVLQAWV